MGGIFALDIAARTGFAYGAPGEHPASGSVLLREREEPQAVAFANMMDFLCDQWSAHGKPALVVKEAPLRLQAFRDLGNAEAVVRMTFGLHSIVEAICIRFGVRCEDGDVSTIRKHFIGKGRVGDRAATKAAVVGRCHLLGLMPRECLDDNRADALAVFDWASATFGRKSVDRERLFLFGEAPAPFVTLGDAAERVVEKLARGRT